MNLYDLPKYYDLSYSWNMRDELLFLKQVFKKYLNKQSLHLMEPACGTGRLLVPFIRCGFQCTGFDINRNALEYLESKLEKNGLSANIQEADMSSFDFGRNRFDGAYCTVDSFRHLLTDDDAIEHLRKVSRSLKPKGIYVLGLHLLPVNGVSKTDHRWQGKRGRLLVKSSIRVMDINRKKRHEILQYQLRVNGQIFQSTYPLRTYTLPQFKRLLKEANCFAIKSIYDLEYDLDKPITPDKNTEDIVVLLEKT